MDAETRTEILETTNRTFCEYGHAGLMVQRVAGKVSVTSVVIHYHLDTKEELLNTSLNGLIGRFESELPCESADPRTQLNTVLDTVFNPRSPGTDGFPVVVMELKVQAPHHELLYEHPLDFDGTMWEVVADIVRDGVADGGFDETDPEKIARLVTTMNDGAHARVVAPDEYLAEARRIVEDALGLHLGWTPGKRVGR